MQWFKSCKTHYSRKAFCKFAANHRRTANRCLFMKHTRTTETPTIGRADRVQSTHSRSYPCPGVLCEYVFRIMFYERTQGKRRTLPSVRRAKCAARLAYNTSGTHWRRTGKRVAYLDTSGAPYTQAAHRVPPCGGLWRWLVCRVPLQLVRLAAACVCRRWRFLASSTHAVYIRFFGL